MIGVVKITGYRLRWNAPLFTCDMLDRYLTSLNLSSSSGKWERHYTFHWLTVRSQTPGTEQTFSIYQSLLILWTFLMGLLAAQMSGRTCMVWWISLVGAIKPTGHLEHYVYTFMSIEGIFSQKCLFPSQFGPVRTEKGKKEEKKTWE